MSSGACATRLALDLPQVAKSGDGYDFCPSSHTWQLSKEVTISLSFLRDVDLESDLGFKLTLTRYAQEYSAHHTMNMKACFRRFVLDTKTLAVTVEALVNWRSQLEVTHEWKLGALRGFLVAWNEWGFPGVSDEVVSLLRGWCIEGNEKGRAVAQSDPKSGPYTDIEIGSILDWANRAFSLREIDLEAYSYFLTLLMTARRPGQIAALRGLDLVSKGDGNSSTEYQIRFPRCKQRGAGFRQHYRRLPVIEDLYLTLYAQHQASVARVIVALGCDVPVDLLQEIPVFVNSAVLDNLRSPAALRDILMGDAPDRLHAPSRNLKHKLDRCMAACTAKSERTGERIRVSAMRFRYTRGTNLRRAGFGAEVIADLLDHSDTQNVTTYTENTVQETEFINRLVGPKLAPFAQACAGALVNSEREAIRGDDPGSRVPNHKQEAVGTCGNYSFCASGYRACYTCHHFQPWLYGPHEEVRTELYSEKERAADAGCAREVVNANDRLILAVEHCVALCEEAKAARCPAPQPIEGPLQEVTDG